MRTPSFRSLMVKFSALPLVFGLVACGGPTPEQEPDSSLGEQSAREHRSVVITSVPDTDLQLRSGTQPEEASVVIQGATAEAIQQAEDASHPIIIVQGVAPDDIVRSVRAEYLVRDVEAEYIVRGLRPEYIVRGLRPEYIVRGLRPEYIVRGLQAESGARDTASYLVEGVDPAVVTHGLRFVAGIDTGCWGSAPGVVLCMAR